MRAPVHQLTGATSDHDALLDLIGDGRFVLLGEATHGTHEFYRERARITRRLIEDRGFAALAVEADWPDAYRVNRYVRGDDADVSPEEALGDFARFPAWMWRNRDVRDLVGWLRRRNEDTPPERRAGFYGLDLYSLQASMEGVVRYLDRVDPAAAARARERYACFERVTPGPEDGRAYGLHAFGAGESCEDEVVEQLVDVLRNAAEYGRRDGTAAEDEAFHAEQNARVVAKAEEYYRSMFGARASSWNLRDRHMTDTLDTLADHLSRRLGEPAKLVVWAHNSHLGDARETEMGWEGEMNVGQLVRERHAGDAVLVGFTTYAGTVTAASRWDGDPARRSVRPALPGSYEALLHRLGPPAFLLPLRDAAPELPSEAIERAIGVVYRPETERSSHYFRARLPRQFDAVLHVDTTRALEPLDAAGGWERREEPPETFPWAV